MGDERPDGGSSHGDAADPVPDTTTGPRWARPAGDEFGWRGWILVGAIVLSFLVIPVSLVIVAHRPELVGSLGLTFRDAYLVLPMIPAVLLAFVAVWAALHARRR